MYAEVPWVLAFSGTQVQQQVILNPDYLPDYLSISYDYGYTYVQIKFLDNFFFQKFSTPTFYNSPFFGFYLHFFKLFVFLPLPSLIAHFGKFLSLPFTKGGMKMTGRNQKLHFGHIKSKLTLTRSCCQSLLKFF